KLKRAQERAEAARPFAERMERMLGTLASSITSPENAPPLLAGRYVNGELQGGTHLLIALTSDRGLCGGFNGSIAKAVRLKVRQLKGEGKQVKVITVGKKGYELLKSHIGKTIIDRVEGISRKPISYGEAEE